MRTLIVVALIAATASALPVPNTIRGLWKSEVNKFTSWTASEIKGLLGTKLVSLPSHIMDNTTAASIPESFDAREQWPSCIHEVRDQAHCGSCWAFGASEAFSDRLCIASMGKVNVVLSPEQLVSCDWEGNAGCNGGIPHLAWDYMEFAGLVSDACFPYTAQNGTAAKCTKQCVNGEAWKTYKVKLFSTKGYSSESAIQTALMSNGPLEAAFSVYEDFMSYKSGVYEHSTGSLLGGHAIKLVGWGVEQGVKYWTLANSWGADWGEKGFFRIRRGVNECGIENGVVAGLPEVPQAASAGEDSKLCTTCRNVADALVSKLINLVFQGTVVGGCGELCSKLDNKTEAAVCDGLCTLAGEVAFKEAIQIARLNPEKLCDWIHVCNA